ncbi:MAG TPA: Crp/Fnr family transcriptional regulator [Casimicrobiaceae bacterium]|jgi:CRP/FNR family transcriptional regulator|nr:Crp/Fnr family transcriptional regulator [Casimicrobiaceae bacterium]
MTPSPDSIARTTVTLQTLFPALADAAPASLTRIVEHGIHRKVRAGTILFDAHTPCGGFPLVLSGTVKVLQRYPNGRELPLYRVRPGESCLLSGSCLLGHSDYTASGIAETDVELLILPATDFHALIASDEAFRHHVFNLFGERLATLLSLVEAIAYQKLDQRLAALLLAKGDPVNATHQMLADELGSVREIVSRLLRSFEDRGWVDVARERIRIVDRAALAALTQG